MTEHETMEEAVAAFARAVEGERENFRRWPRLDGRGNRIEPDPYQTEPECRAHWSLCCKARQAAEEALLVCGSALRAKREAA